MDAPPPKNVTQLMTFLGMLNYYGKLLSNLSKQLDLLYSLLKKKSQWSWGAELKNIFKQVKSMLTSSCLLMHYDPNKPLILTCDSSPYGVGAMLSH